jgi:5-methylcytosine-specific restriction endonuclease McrA
MKRRDKNQDYYRLINCRQWQQLRHRKLLANPLCELCYQNDIYTPAREVHHIIPAESAISHEEMSRLMYDYDNLQSLCHDCHVEIHRQMMSRSKATIKARNASRTQRFADKFLSPSDSAREGGAFFIQAPIATNTRPQLGEKFWVLKNVGGGK